MVVIETWLTTDLKKPVHVKQLSGNIFSGDSNGNQIGVEILDNGSPASISGSVHGYIIRPDHETVVVDGTLTDNKAYIVLPASVYVVVGQVSIVIKVGTTTVGACTSYVYRTTTDVIVDPGHVVPDISELLALIDDCIEATDAANSAAEIAEEAAETVLSMIDDTKGIGDTNSVWSADKDVKELDKKATVVTESITSPADVQTITDGADGMPMEMTVGIEPVQDLHGYDYPWAAGAWKNLVSNTMFENGGISSSGANSSSNTEIRLTGYIQVTEGETYSYNCFNSTVNYGHVYFYNASSYMSRESWDATSGSKTFTVPTGAVSIRIKFGFGSEENRPAIADLVVQLEKNIAPTSYAPYENVCPISGWTGANVTRIGRNYASGFESTTINGITYTVNRDGSVTANGTATANAYYSISIDTSVAYGDYIFGTLSGGSSSTYCLYVWDNDDNVCCKKWNGSNGTYLASGWGEAKIIQGHDTVICFKVSSGKTVNNVTVRMLVLKSEADKPFVYQISFPSQAGTVYGGTLSINKDGSGELVVDRYRVYVDNTTSFTMNNGGFYANNVFYDVPFTDETTNLFKCNKYKEATAISNSSQVPDKPNGSFFNHSTSYRTRLWVKDNRFATEDDFVDSLETEPIEIVCPMLTPITYNFTASQIRSLLGTNNVWADTGNVLQLDYSADTKLYVNKQLTASQNLIELLITANHESSMKATRAYSSGDLLIVNSTLYKATTSIANGATLTVGTNVTATTVAAEIAALS